MYMYVAYIFSLFSRKGGGGGLACDVLYEHVCIWRNSYHFIHGTWRRQIGIRTYLYYSLIQCTLSHNSWTDQQYLKQGTEKHRQSTLWWFWYWFCKKKIQQSCACIPFRRRDGAVKISGVHSFSIRKTMFLVVSCIYYIPMCKSNKVHVKWRYSREMYINIILE